MLEINKVRDIKFRYWNGKTMEYYFHICSDEGKVYECSSGSYGDEMSMMPGYSDKVDNFILMQYTGLKDKNNKEIWEGDIFETESGTTFNIGWNNLQHRWSCYNKNDDCRFHLNEGVEIEVIGNIYQNPELK